MLLNGTILYYPAYVADQLTGFDTYTVRHLDDKKGIYDAQGELFARYFNGIGFVTPSVRYQTGIWSLQRQVFWNPTYGMKQIPDGALVMRTAPLEDYPVLQKAHHLVKEKAEIAREHGTVYLMSFPDTSLGYRVEIPTFAEEGCSRYIYLLTPTELLDIFGSAEFTSRFRGHHQTFYY